MAALSKPIDIEEIDQGMERSMAAVNVGTSVCVCACIYMYTSVYVSVCASDCMPLVGCSSLSCSLCTYTYYVVHICACVCGATVH